MFECYGQEVERCCPASLAAAESSGASVEAKDARDAEGLKRDARRDSTTIRRLWPEGM